ncbi:hypothetical protein [Variovorax saccharolyticus]|uniref:hypothetical protein n=1 Tax=Variovorax saccharolyticus TaxID=3053516 RepID=UPI0025749566|nr:hypothetical protein [Variovorax sp. J31P216]MDM0029582.1 hypothetical protein [Variovorax sp. J31P216]
MKRPSATLLLFVPQLIFAQQLTALSIDRERVAVNEPIKLTLEFQAADKMWCGLKVNFGDGDEREVGVDRNPIVLKKEYAAAGRYRIRAEGKILLRGLRSAIPCFGSEQSPQIVIIDPAADRSAQREAEAKARELDDREAQLRARERALEERASASSVPATKRLPPTAVAKPPKPQPVPPKKDETLKIFTTPPAN